MEWLHQIEPWHWLTLCIVLLGLEALGSAGFLLGAALAAGMLAIFKWALPELSWQWQLSLFAILSVVFSVMYWRRFRRFNQRTDHPVINQRTKAMIGKEYRLDVAIHAGTSKVQLGDTFWKVTSEVDIAPDVRFRIIDADTDSLVVAPIK